MIIYKITNLINNKIYVGQTNGKRSRYFGGGKLIRWAIRKYGKNNFKKEIIVQGDFNQCLTDDLEIHYIQLFNSTTKGHGYNLELGGHGGRAKVLILSDEARRTKSEKMKKHWQNLDYKMKVSKSIKDSITPERRSRISYHLSRRVVKDETRLKHSKNHKGKSLYKYKTYKDGILYKEYTSELEMQTDLKISISTFKPKFNLNISYKGYTFMRELKE